ncbi:hypothetical protein YC2023_100898 [Brassica napus]
MGQIWAYKIDSDSIFCRKDCFGVQTTNVIGVISNRGMRVVYIIKSKWVTPRYNRNTKGPNINGLQHTAEAPNNLDGPSAQPYKTGRSRPMRETRKQKKRHGDDLHHSDRHAFLRLNLPFIDSGRNRKRSPDRSFRRSSDTRRASTETTYLPCFYNMSEVFLKPSRSPPTQPNFQPLEKSSFYPHCQHAEEINRNTRSSPPLNRLKP